MLILLLKTSQRRWILLPGIKGFLEAFKDNLMPSLTEDKFSDMYSQTITYGLFSLRMRHGEEKFSRLSAYQNIPPTIPFLKRLFYFLTGPNLPQSIEWLVDDITSVLENTDIDAIHRELHTERWIDDPVIHFYETFLSVYNPSEDNKSPFIEELMEDYKRDVKGERNIQPLSDDYIKFLRFAQWKIEKTGKGIVGFITNNSYLSGLIHRGMRKRLLNAFDEIYILNLHGSSRTGEKPPDGIADENVFNIQQGVAISLFVKL
jgi:hypothetical protein